MIFLKFKPTERQMLAGIGGESFLGHMEFWMDSEGLIRFGKANPFCISRFYRAFTLTVLSILIVKKLT